MKYIVSLFRKNYVLILFSPIILNAVLNFLNPNSFNNFLQAKNLVLFISFTLGSFFYFYLSRMIKTFLKFNFKVGMTKADLVRIVLFKSRWWDFNFPFIKRNSCNTRKNSEMARWTNGNQHHSHDCHLQ